MGRRRNHLKAAKSLHEEEGDEIKEERSQLKATTNSSTVISSDDEEGNEDLSLKIVEKALLRACTSGQRTDADSQEPKRGAESTGVVSVSLLSSEGGEDVAADMKSKKKIKKEKKKIEKVVVLEEAVVAIKDEENADIVKAIENMETIENVETNPVEKSDNIVLRKLLRGPRYFDPPDSGWGTCYNCGEEGHTTVNCTSAKRRRPCFICGSLEHNAKQCVKGQDCFICKKGGHRAKDCPEKYKGASKISKICLRCGDAGHDMFSCKNNYSAEDLKEIQCYICKCFGHLCCADFTDTSARELSCYRCGQLGHGGLECLKSHRERASVESVSLCFKCGEGGHFARECPNSTKECRKSHGKRSSVGSVSSCFKCGEGGHFARECPISTKVRKRNLELATPTHVKANLEVSTPTYAKRNIELSTPTQNISKENTKSKRVRSVPSDIGNAQKRKKAQSQEGQFATSSSSKKRGGWITEDPGDLSSGKAKVWGLKSPVTPTNKKNNIYTSGVGIHTSVSRSSTNTHIRHFRDPPSHGAPHSHGSPHSYRSPHSHGPPLSYAPHPSYAPSPSYASYGTPPPFGTPPSYRAPSAYRAPPPFYQHRYTGTRFVNFR